MAVFTQVKTSEVADLLARYEVGELIALTEIGQGIENSNYFLNTKQGGQEFRWVLTVFETLSEDELPFFMVYTGLLSRQGLPVPAPLPDKNGGTVQHLVGKPAAIFPCFPGRWEAAPTITQCQSVGAMISQMHSVPVPKELSRLPTRTMTWMRANANRLEKVRGFTEGGLLNLALNTLDELESGYALCKMGIVHGDMFRDNVLFDKDRISGVIDFYHACRDYLAFDVAVAANDWCFDMVVKQHNRAMMEALLDGYNRSGLNVIQPADVDWPAFLLLAAVRFWISRLVSRHLPGYQGRATTGDITKDPEEFRIKVEAALHLLSR